MRNILEAKNLTKTYINGNCKEQNILKNINLEIKESEFVSIMGPSGSGKSTLLYNVSGMDRITSGNIYFDNNDITNFTEKELSKLRLNKMGFIFQQIYLLKNLCILDNIILSAYLGKKEDRKSIKKRAIELMNKTGIDKLANNDITQASGGQLQRVGICRALINNPNIIFGDEPTGALDSKATTEIMDILTNFNQSGVTIFLVTHDAKVAAKTERVLFMLDGSIVGEYYLGKYIKENNDIKLREEKLSNWLNPMGF